MFWPFKAKPKRLIFNYHDGTRERNDDPLAIRSRLDNHPTYRFDVHPVLAEKGDAAAFEIVLAAICDAFKVERYNPDTKSGMTQTELVQLLIKFGEYLESVKKNIFWMPSSGSSTGEEAPSGSRNPTTNGMSG
jgi:hypothetical protein